MMGDGGHFDGKEPLDCKNVVVILLVVVVFLSLGEH